MNNEEKIFDLLSQMNDRLEKMDDRLEKMDDRLERMDDRLENIDTRLIQVELTQENVILPQLTLLAEGQKTILETLAPKNRVEALEDEMVFLKTVIRSLATEVDKLKKAQ